MDDFYEEYALGIDLGTTYSCVSIFRNGTIEIIPNEISERTTPSVVTFLSGGDIKAGEQTLNYEIKNPQNTIYSIKRLIGREYDIKLEEEIKKENWPFKVEKIKENSKPKIKIELENEIKYYYPEEISSIVLKKLLKSSEEYLQKKVDKAVITVPHNFTSSQREATKQAAEMAGIKVLHLLSEPTAASLAYGLEKKLSNLTQESLRLSDNNYKIEKNILTFDLGGGTFDISILELAEKEENIFNVKATSGDNHLGGDDFDNKLVDYCLDIFCENNNINKNSIISDKRCMKKLKKQCENSKVILSAKEETHIYIDEFINEKDLDIKITRAKFEDLCKNLFDKLLYHIEKALKDSKLDKSKINEVVLIGGSTKIPKVKDIIYSYFKGIKINSEINPDETVAYGAGLYAAKLIRQGGDTINDLVLMDITPLSLGTSVDNQSQDKNIKTLGKLMNFIIPRGTRIPITLFKNYTSIIDNQEKMLIDIYEGERKYIKDNHLLGKFKIELPPRPKGKAKVKVCINVDENGILNITAQEISGKDKKSLKIRNDKEIINENELNEIKKKNRNIFNKSELNKEKNYKKKIREYYNYYIKADNSEYKKKYLKEYNLSIIEFIETFDFKNLDNVTVFEKLYLYVKLLFESYHKIILLDSNLEPIYEEEIKNQCKKYLKLLIKINPYCIHQLLSLLINIKDNILYELVIFVMKLYYDNGIKYLNNEHYFDKNYKARNEFINCLKLSQNYIEHSKLILFKCLEEEHNNIIFNSKLNINKIESSLKINIDLKNNFDNQKLFTNDQYLDKDHLLILLGKYRESLESTLNMINNIKNMNIQDIDKMMTNEIETEAILLANIVKIQYTYLQKGNNKSLKTLAEQSVNLAMSINKNWDNILWYKEIKSILEEIRKSFIRIEIIDEEEFKEKMLEEKKDIFDEIEKYTQKSNLEFIKFIIEKHPPRRYIKENKSIEDQWKEDKINLINVLSAKYHPSNYPKNTEDDHLKYLIVEKISEHLNNIYREMNPNLHICEDD